MEAIVKTDMRMSGLVDRWRRQDRIQSTQDLQAAERGLPSLNVVGTSRDDLL
jgi:hypothetical protein